ncbi:23S rRNA (pseudouridine(1915)-N(3))-methyltransferase RlmH [Paenibacillus zanthoxyli]|uniref:23S rRNA (pseudouridine(1915)-N(3))-methyltransferase RlmH n=1 Tax=Paenibacillus zanthoxyli TaxID=369399 RepID=UPI0038CD5044
MRGLASKINNWAISGISEIVFVINTNDTPHQDTVTLSQMKMDFGLQTTVLMEQIYRAYRNINNHPYHK